MHVSKYCNFVFRGKGSVVGLLKMGRKKLYVFDAAGLVHEKDCLCVLDFYVHESRQRKGYGKKLFEFMLNVCIMLINLTFLF